MKILRYLFLILALSVICSCAEKDEFKIDTEHILHYGEHFEFQLTCEIKNVKEPLITCLLKDENGNIFERTAFLHLIDNYAIVNFMQGLAEGKYMLLSIGYLPNDGIWQGESSIGVGRYLEAANGVIKVTGSYSSKYGWGGSGTKDDPWKISSEDNLYNMMGYVNEAGRDIPFLGEYFVQERDLDMKSYSDYTNMEYGWLPIGESAATPFAGSYDGQGYKVSNLWMNRNLQSGVGLFGALYNGKIENVVLHNANIVGDGAVGGIAGAVIGDGTAMGVSVIKNCKLDNCKISGNVGVGGLVGMVDINVRLQLDNCETDENSTISCNDQAVGGILGGAVTKSSVSFVACTNKVSINPKSVNGGGIAGGVDTAIVLSCKNYGNIIAPKDNQAVMAIGGILGGAGTTNIVNSINYGAVEGYKGIGGMIGSSLVTVSDDGSGAIYNNVYIQSSTNKGKIHGNSMVGGLCGEAQIAAYQSSNEGDVEANDDYAGGIFGSSSVAAVHCCANFGGVVADSNVGGIGGKVQEGTFALNTNFGYVDGYVNNAGGIFGKVGNQAVINYCGNYGTIWLKDEGNIGGIAGEIGDPREWSGWDIAEVIIGAAEMVTGFFGGTMFCYFATSGATAAMHAVHITHTVADIALTLANTVTIGYASNLLNFPEEEDYVGQARIMAQKLEEECKANFTALETQVNSAISSSKFSASSLKLSSKPMDVLKVNRTEQVNFYIKDSLNHRFFNDRLNETRSERYHEVEHDKHSKELAHTIAQGVCMGLTIAGMILGAVATGGFSVVVGAATATVGVVGGLNSVTKAVTNYDANTLVISQCFNYGKVDGAAVSKSGGIVGRMADYSKISNCLNGGYLNTGYSIVEKGGGEVTIEYCLNIDGDEPIGIVGDLSTGFHNIDYNKIYCHVLSWDDWDYESRFYNDYHLDGPDDLLVTANVCKQSSYPGWDFSKKWSFPDSGTEGMYPVPRASMMTYASESEGH